MSRVVLIIYLLVLYALISNLSIAPKAKNKSFIIFSSLGLIIDSGLRHLSIGPDTYQYYLMFEEAKSYTISDLFKSTFGIGIYSNVKDVGYWLFVRLFQQIFSSFRMFLIFIAVFFFTALGRFIYKNTDDLRSILLSYLFYIGMFWYFFSTTGCRQTISVSLLMFAFPYLVEGKYIKYVAVILVSTLFHASAICAMLGVLVMFVHSKRFFSILVITLIPIIFVARYKLFAFLIESLNVQDVYGVYLETKETASSIVVTMFYFIILVLCIAYRDRLTTSKSMDCCMKLYFLGMCLLPTMYIAATAMRVTFYFTYTMYLIIPSIIKHLNVPNKYVMSVLLMMILSFFSIRQTWEYKFFWESGIVTSSNGISVQYKEEMPF